MKPLVNAVLFLTWVAGYLAAVAGVSHQRARALGLTGRRDYRADKDISLSLMTFALGSLLCFLIYLATRALSHLF